MILRKELIFDYVGGLIHIGDDVSLHLTFREPANTDKQRYGLDQRVSAFLLTTWGIRTESPDYNEKVKAILFQAAEKYIERMAFENQLDTLLIGSDASHLFPNPFDSECPFDLNRALPKFPFNRVFWQRKGKKPTEQKDEEHFEFLRRLYELHERAESETVSFRAFDIGDEIGLSRQKVESIYEYLADKEFVEIMTHDRNAEVDITIAGMEFVEKTKELLDGGKKSSLQPLVSPPPTQFYVTRDNLHPKIVERAWEPFEHERYDDAVLNAMKVVEVEVRSKSGCDDEDIGVNLISKAMNPKDPILRFSKISAEQEAVHSLFRGAIGAFKNPQSHKFVDISDPVKTFEYLCLASLLVRMLDEAQKV